MSVKQIVIYCDGACLGNPGPGGYAALLMLKGQPQTEKIVSGYELNTTNNRMELKAAIEGLKALTRPCQVDIFSDSQYVVKGMTQWLQNWIRSNFTSSSKKAIANVDLWRELHTVSSKHQVKWQWVKAHAGLELNERVDEIAKEQAGLALHTLRLTHA